jgi:hypothetical protein
VKCQLQNSARDAGAYTARPEDRKRKRLISEEKMAGVGAATMNTTLESEAAKGMDKDDEAATVSSEKLVIIKRKHSTKKVERKIKDKSK